MCSIIISGSTYTTGQGSDAKDKIELSMAAVIYDVFRTRHIELIEF